MKCLILALLAIAGHAMAGTAVLTCTAPTQNDDNTPIDLPITYRFYRGTTAAAVTASTTPIGTASTCAYTDSAAPVGMVFYAVTAVTVKGESVKSAVVSKVIAPLPNAPINLQFVVPTAANVAYKLRQSVDGFTLVAIGTVTPGTACDGARTVNGEYVLVPRSAVTLASRFDALPLTVFAKCAPAA